MASALSFCDAQVVSQVDIADILTKTMHGEKQSAGMSLQALIDNLPQVQHLALLQSIALGTHHARGYQNVRVQFLPANLPPALWHAQP